MRFSFYLLATVLACMPFAANANSKTFQDAVNQYNEENYVQSLKIFKSLEENGDRRALYALGLMYERGLGTDENAETASGFYQQAAKYGDSRAQNRLGLFYLNGNGVRKDLDKAYSWFNQSAENGYKYGAWNAAKFVFNASPSHFSVTRLQDSLAYAKQAERLGHERADSIVGTLECALNDSVSASQDVFDDRASSHYEIKGPVKTIDFSASVNRRTLYFGKGGHLLREVLPASNFEVHYTYDSQCNLLRWEPRNYADNGSRNYSVSNFENYTYQNDKLSSIEAASGRSFKVHRVPQANGNIVKVRKEVGVEYPTENYREYNSSGLLVWSSTVPSSKPSAFLHIVPGPGSYYYRVLNEGSRRMRFEGGNQFLYKNNGMLRKVIDNNDIDRSYQSSTEYIYGSDGWIREEVFNGTSKRESSVERLEYNDYELDKKGNWVSRSKNYRYKGDDLSTRQSREITYY